MLAKSLTLNPTVKGPTMPEIAELKTIDGQVWARIPLSGDEGCVTLYTADELHKHDADLRKYYLEVACAWAMRNNYATGPGDTIEDVMSEVVGQAREEAYKLGLAAR